MLSLCCRLFRKSLGPLIFCLILCKTVFKWGIKHSFPDVILKHFFIWCFLCFWVSFTAFSKTFILSAWCSFFATAFPFHIFFDFLIAVILALSHPSPTFCPWTLSEVHSVDESKNRDVWSRNQLPSLPPLFSVTQLSLVFCSKACPSPDPDLCVLLCDGAEASCGRTERRRCRQERGGGREKARNENSGGFHRSLLNLQDKNNQCNNSLCFIDIMKKGAWPEKIFNYICFSDPWKNMTL